MFLKTKEMKKRMNASMKQRGLVVGNTNERYLVYSDEWGLCVECEFVSKKLKKALIDLTGRLPEPGECVRFFYDERDQLKQEVVLECLNHYELCMNDECTIATPLFLRNWNQEYQLYQKKSDLKFVAVLSNMTDAVISPVELDLDFETMPPHPFFYGNTLYYKNEIMIYWVKACDPGRRIREMIYPKLAGLNFFEYNWM